VDAIKTRNVGDNYYTLYPPHAKGPVG